MVYGNRTIVDLTGDTVAPNTLLSGVTAHDASGEAIAGTVMPIKISATKPTGHGFLWVKPLTMSAVYEPVTSGSDIAFSESNPIELEFTSESNYVVAASKYIYRLEFEVHAVSGGVRSVSFIATVGKGEDSVEFTASSAVDISANESVSIVLEATSETKLLTNGNAIAVSIEASTADMSNLYLTTGSNISLTINASYQDSMTACGIYYVT